MVSYKRFPVNKILFFIDGITNPNAGTEGQLIHLIDGIVKSGGNPKILTLSSSDYLRDGNFSYGMDVLGSKKIASPILWVKLWFRAIRYRTQGYRIVHCFFNDAALIGPIIFKLAGIKTVTSRRDMGIWYTPIKLRILKIGRYFTDICISNSLAVKQHTIKHEKFKKENIQVIYNGYFFSSEASFNNELPNEYRSFIENCFVLGMVANLRPVKRVNDAIIALSEVIKKHPSVRLVIVGSHDPRDPTDFLDLASELGVRNRIFFAGRQSEAQQWMRSFDVALLCSESEGFSNSILEYQVCGVPVICSKVGGNPEIITDGLNGMLYSKGDVMQLATNISHLIENPDLRKSMGSNGEKLVKESFTFERMISEHGQIYESIVRE